MMYAGAAVASATNRGIALRRMQREETARAFVVPPKPTPRAPHRRTATEISDIPFADVSWAERAIAYRQSVAAMSVPACHRPRLTSAIVLAQVSEAHGVKVAEVKGPRRNRKVVAARQEAMWRLKNELGRSLPQIGQLLGGRDHTTVLHGVRQHEKRITEQALCSR